MTGAIPGDWSELDLGTLAVILDTLRIPLSSVQRAGRSGRYPYCGANGVLDYIDDFRIDDDVILLAEDGGNFDQFAERPIAYRMRGKIWVNNHAHVLKAANGETSFLFYALEHKDIRPYISSGTRSKLTRSELVRIKVAVPNSRDEQRCIASSIEAVDKHIVSLERLITKKQAIKQGMMQGLLTGRIRLPGFAGQWSDVTAGDIGTFKGGSGFPLVFQGAETGKFPFFKVSDMNTESNELFMNRANNYVSETQRKQMAALVMPPGAIVFAKVGAAVFLERKRILTVPSCIDNNMAAFILDTSRADIRFIYYVLCSFRMGSLVATGALPSLNGRQLRSIPIALPDKISEQQAIARALADADFEIDVIQRRITKARAIKQGMMQELLTGRTRLPVREAVA